MKLGVVAGFALLHKRELTILAVTCRERIQAPSFFLKREEAKLESVFRAISTRNVVSSVGNIGISSFLLPRSFARNKERTMTQ